MTKIPSGYRDWRLISVAREEGTLDDIRAILGNDKAIKSYREGKLPFPDGTIIARLAWSYDPSEENNKVFGRPQSFVAGHPKNGVQFMVKDSRKYASTGGWGFGSLRRRKIRGRGSTQNLLTLPPGCCSSRPCLHPLRTLILRTTEERNETMTTHKSTAASVLSRRAWRAFRSASRSSWKSFSRWRSKDASINVRSPRQ